MAEVLITCQTAFIGYKFELTGGAPALDLANTVSERKAGAVERLLGYRDLVDWAEQGGIVSAATAKRLRAAAVEHPDQAEAVRGRAVALRALVFRVLTPGKPVAAEDLRALDRWVLRAQARRHLRQVGDGGGVGWVWDEELGWPLWPVVLDAAAILTDGRRERVRACQGERCAWLFLDRSRRQDRRWCDMTSCGNRAKARRHHLRMKRAEPSAPVRNGLRPG